MGSFSSFQNIKDLKFVFTLGSWMKPFSQNGNQFNSITLQGLRASVNIENAGGAMMGTLNASIYGLPLDHVNKLTSLMWKTPILASSGSSFSEFTVQVYTIDGTQESLLFNGEVLNAWADFSGMPQVALLVQANVGYSALVNASTPLSLPANTTVGTVMGQLAQKMGFSFECKDSALASQVVSSGSYYGNTAMEQARSMEDAYKFWMYQDATTDPPTLAIAPWGKARQSLAVEITPQTGLIGYPLFNSSGVTFSCYYNPNIIFGGPVQISGSNVEQANAQWTVTSMSHQLSSQTPNGPWQSSIQAVSANFGQLFSLLGGGGA
jgi:hypothetical protein